MELVKDPKVEAIFNFYPKVIKDNLKVLRKLILDSAAETDGLKKLIETVKWGEASYLTKNGSTIRLGWKSSIPDRYSIYFICTTGLVDTFKMVHGDLFEYEGNRAIHFTLSDEVPTEPLKACIGMALNYHKIKHLPLLGA
ncbi:MAG: DUF1801 domain-containing protein [Cyclobacteriaceae bacterium]